MESGVGRQEGFEVNRVRDERKNLRDFPGLGIKMKKRGTWRKP